MNGELISMNLSGYVDQGEVGDTPYRINVDGQPYVPVGDGGVVLGYRLGDGVFARAGDHAAPGVCLVHPEEAAGYALSSFACAGNVVEVRTGTATGSRGVVLGKRGGGGRVIAVFAQSVLHQLRPHDQVTLRAEGTGVAAPVDGLRTHNVAPALLSRLVSVVSGRARVSVRASVASRVVGNGIGRPTPSWDLDLQVDETGAPTSGLLLGDLVAITDLDASFNAGYRRDWASVGVVVHGASPEPGHGPGVTVILTGPRELFEIVIEPEGHFGVSEEMLFDVAEIKD